MADENSKTAPADGALDTPAGEAGAGALAARVGDRLAALLREPLAAGLYIVATPIGNLGDISLRALTVLASVDAVCCEDTRHTRTLLSTFGLATRLRPYHEHNAERERPKLLAELAAGARIALVSDAGTPLVSDPGYKLVREAADAGHHVSTIPGASAVTAALALAGLPTDRFLFAGFLAPRKAARRRQLAELGETHATLVLFEAPGRLGDCVCDIAEVLGGREVVVAREITKRFEEVLRGPATALAARLCETPVRGECVVMVGPAASAHADISDELILADLEAALARRSMRDAVHDIATARALPRRRVYDLALALQRRQSGGDDQP